MLEEKAAITWLLLHAKKKRIADLSFDYIEEWLVNVAKIVSALKLSFIWSKKTFIHLLMWLWV